MSGGSLRTPLPWLLVVALLAILGHVTAQTYPCPQHQQQVCANGGVCRRAYLSPGYICECSGDWHGQNCDTRFPGTSVIQPKECGSNFYNESGTILSPNYPNRETHNQDCYYLVRIPSALSVSFRFNAFSSEEFKDELYIIPGTMVDLNLPGVRIYNGTLQANFPLQVFDTNQVVLYWLTDRNVASPGFSIDYSIDRDPCWANPCQNGGTCSTIGRDYSCNCLPDFSGNDCQTGTVIISQTTIGISVGNTLFEGRSSHALTFDLTFAPGATQFSLTGSGLWSVTLFLTDSGGTNRVATQVVPLSSQQSSVAWNPPASSILRSLQTSVNLNMLSCPQMHSVCATIGQGSNPAPPFSMRGTPDQNALNGCTPVQCRGLEVTSVTFSGTLNDLREGVGSQTLRFDLTMTTNSQAGSISGSNLWKVTLFGNTQPNGLGAEVLRTRLALSPSQAGAGTDLGGNVRFFSLQTTLSLIGLVCSQLRYICVTIEKSESPTPQFTLSGVPSDTVLTACQAMTCHGVQVTGTSISVTSGTPVIERRSNTLAFTLSIRTNSSGGSVNGQNLFSIQTFGSNSLTGTSIRISEHRIQGSTGITAGLVATIPNLSTNVDLSGRLCQDIVALCTVLAKNAQANPDFTLDPIPSSSVLQECESIECRGVYIQTMNVVVTSGLPVLYGNRNQMLICNLRVRANTPSASITGFNLWRLIVYANNRLDGSGPRIGQVEVALSSAQQRTAISAGQAVNLNNLDFTMDLSSVTSCADITYLCVELQKGLNPSPPFTLQGSTTKCTQVQCAMFNPCGSNPCLNGGACQNAGSSFTCSCANGWTGPLCQQAMNACSGIVCRNGGTCTDQQFSYDCECVLGWRGQLCELVDHGVQITTTTLTVTSGTIRENEAQNSLTLSVVLSNSQSGSTLLAGSGYWQVNVFTSSQINGQRFNELTLNLNAFQSGLGIASGGVLTLSGLQSVLNLQGQTCSSVSYICVEVRKGNRPLPDFLLSGSLIACQETNCLGVQVIQVTGSINSGQPLVIGQTGHTVNMNVIARASSNGASIRGSNLWTAQVFTNTQQNGAGNTYLQQNAFLTGPVVSLDLIAGGSITLSGAIVTFDLSTVTSCQQVSFLCVRLGKNSLASPDFTLSGVPDDSILTHCQAASCQVPSPCDSHSCQNGANCQALGTSYICICPNGWTGDRCSQAVNACLRVVCANGGTCMDNQFSFVCRCALGWQGTNCQQVNQGVIITVVQLFFNNVVFREGIVNNINFNAIISSDALGQSITGSGLWQFNVFGCLQADGGGTRYGLNGAIYNPAQSGQLLAGGSVTINGLRVALDFSQVLCLQVPYICVEVLPGTAAQPPFVLTGNRVACAPINCVGVQITSTTLRVLSTSDVKERDTNNPLTLDLIITTNPNGGSVSGIRLWRMSAFLSTQPDGSGPEYSTTPIQLSDAQAGTSLQAGLTATISSLQTNANTAQSNLMCGQFGYVCVRLERGQNPSVDFQLGDGTQTYVACAPVNCRGVEITDVVATIVAGEPVNSETTTNNLVFDVLVSSSSSGASVSGSNLWQVIVFSDTQLNGQGQTVIQAQATLSATTASTFLQAGADMVLRSAQVNLDLTQISCNQIPYICVRFSKAANPGPSPDFTFSAVPSDDVLLHCQPLDCMDPSSCINNLCENGAQCMHLDSASYRCVCTPGWTGIYCNVVADYCLIAQTPCFNGGQCLSLADRYQCNCLQAWVGPRCQIDNPCLPINPCLNGGTCFSDQTGLYTCDCRTGYSGGNCQIAPDPCISDLCQNGARCERIGTGSDYQCFCLPGFSGRYCNITLDPCDSSPCFNGGTCTQVGTLYAYRCVCTAEYTGPSCQIPIDLCSPNPCFNGGVCSSGQGSTNFVCQCSLGFAGPTCLTRLDPCISNPCRNNGACSSVGTSFAYQCQCPLGFVGTNCEIPNPCFSNPCQNNGVCSRVGTSFAYQCQCLQGFTGTNCEVPNACISNPCQNGGQCNQLGAGYQCQCQVSWVGPNCNILNPCVSTPCLNGATCALLGTDFTCQCAPGYIGTNCGTSLEPCNSTPCQNGATCTQQGTSFTCRCASGYTGSNCGTVQNPCDLGPCQNGGTCRWFGVVLAYQCSCLVGYNGNNCQIIQDPCSSNPCLNNGQCQWPGTSYTYSCQCILGYTGDICGTALNPCDSNPCMNGGGCSWQFPNYRYECQCPQTHAGFNCEIALGPCFPSPCQNGGTCFNLNQGIGYFCRCLPNYIGPNCQYRDPCEPTPCQNNGVCSASQTGSSYTCSCPANFQGSNCQYPDPCSSQPCQNAGVCVPNGFGTSYFCNCNLAYIGVHCQYSNPCASNPCLNAAQCVTDTIGSIYTCTCVTGFVGDRCEIDDPCLPNPCQNGAICSLVTSGLSYECSCVNGFFGTNCQIPDPCTAGRCLNGGTCSAINGGLNFACSCHPQYLGNTCQFPNLCYSSPCLNSGTCEPHPQGITYTCTCLPNFQGQRCESENHCFSNPCLNGGVCQVGIGGVSYLCSCPTQFLGLRCENRDPCLSNPCRNGGTCDYQAQGLLYSCSCPPSHFGMNCEILDACSSSPCQNGGVCNPSSSSFTCICPQGYSGTLCTTIDPCTRQPCLNGGVCRDSTGPSGFFCRCTSGYIGDTCQIPDLCSYSPCLNGGTCSNIPTASDYRCLCPSLYSGRRCEVFNPCSSNPCQNGGICNRDSLGVIYNCNCVFGYDGTNCEFGPNCFDSTYFHCMSGECVPSARQCDQSFDCQDGSDETSCQRLCTNQEFRCTGGTCINIQLVCNGINDCSDGLDEQNCPSPCDLSPCLNGGSCQNARTSFICTCAQGWTGTTCSQVVSSSNDPPSFLNQVISIEIPENTIAGTQLLELRASDPDSDILTFGLDDFVAQQLFVIVPNHNNPKSAYLTLKSSLDREAQSDYNFVVSVTDDGGNKVIHSGTLLLSDINDNAPTFTNLPNVTTVYENANAGFQIFRVAATDPDIASLSGFVTYAITEGMDAPFSINMYTGEVVVTGPLDYETEQVYSLAITASDQGTNRLSTTMSLTVQVLDVQDTGPIFINLPYDRTINEGLPLNSVVVTVTAVDQDTVNANNITYTILSGNIGGFFELDGTTGELTLVREVDRENLNTPAAVDIVVRATETGTNGGTPAFESFTITINDIDDERPLFNQSAYFVSVSEAENLGYVLPVGIEVSDGEIVIQGNFRITLQDDNIVPFSVSPSSAVDRAMVTLTLIRPLDYETIQSYDLVINAQDTATSTATVVVTVIDANDNDPIFSHGTQTIALEEGASMNTVVTTVTVTDADQGINKETEFSIIAGNQEGLFAVHPTTGVITTTSNIDYETSAGAYTLTVQARNTQPAVAPADGVSEVTVIVTIEDINDSPPVFQQPNYLIQIIELSDTGLTIGRVIADDADSGAAGRVTYTILSGNDDGTFAVHPDSGNIVLLRPLDRETTPVYNITIQAQDSAAPPLSATTYVVVEVRDFNDNDPQWVRSQYSESVVEGQPADTFVVQVMATDADIGLNALLRYELAVTSQYLYINRTSGQIFTTVPLDREQTETIEVNVLVRDSGNPSRSSGQLAVVTVTVLDINDSPPTFTGAPFMFEVSENEPAGTFVGEVTARDPDTIGTLVYSFTSPQTQFQIEPVDGRITTINSLNREQQDRYEVEVQVTDGTFDATADVVIVVTDVNDNQPMFSQALYQVTVVENTPVGTILTLSANDTDIGLNSAIIYQFDLSANGPIGPFILDRVTGQLRTTSPLDRETQDSYTLVVKAVDRQGRPGNLQAVATVIVTVTDVNDNRPVFDLQNYADTVSEDAAEGLEIIQVSASDRDIGDNAVILYRIVQGNANDKFQIDATSGIISRGPTPLDRETKDSYVLTVETYNDGELPPRNTATVTITVTDVNDEVPRFTQDVYLKPDLLENAAAGTVVATVSANDPDLGQGGQIQYSITGGDDGNHFVIDSFTGVITVLGSLPDYSVKSTYNLTVTARDQAQPFHTSQARVMVLLVDAQDDPPEFTMTRYEVNLTENVGEGFPFLQIMAQVPGKASSIVTYSLDSNVNPSILQVFGVDPTTGWLTTRGPIDYETGLPLYTFTVLGVNEDTLPGSAAVWVYIQDVNDNSPVFVSYPTDAVTVDENKDGGFVIATVSANDADSGLNGNVVYEITGGNEAGHFDIIANNGEALIVTTTELDRETTENYMLTITASDQGVPVMNSSIVVEVVVNDLNDNPPGFNQTNYNTSVEENVLLNRPITTILVTDLDTPAANNIVFQIDPASNPNGIFQINSQGEVTITSQLDRELQAFYDLIVVMTDPTYDPSFMETTHVYVTVLDQNDNPPIFPAQPPVTVTEGPSSTGEIVVTVVANDVDTGNNSQMVYTITGGNGEGTFGIYSNNGSIYVINELDWETTQSYELIVTATDQAMNSNDRRSGTVTVVINVEDINDTPPRFAMDYFGPYSFSEGVPGTYIGTFVAVDADSGAGGEVTYTIIGEYSDLFIIDPTSGVLTLKPTAQLDYETSQALNVTIVATDAGVPSLNGTTTIGIVVVNINDNGPKFQGTPYRTGINDTTPVDTWVYQVVATDADAGPEGNVTYSILNGNTNGFFRIDVLTGDVYINNALTNGIYELVIKAQDNPENPANAREETETLTILVADSTSVVPVFPDNGTFRASVQEHSTVGTFVVTISVENSDDVSDLLFAINGPDAGPFLINPSTGVVTVNGLLDAEIQDLHVFNVSVSDSRGASANGKVYVTILNINDNPPQLDDLIFNFTVPEDAGDGYFVGRVNASDDDIFNTMLRFTIERGAQDKFTIDPSTGVITVQVTCRGDSSCDQQPLDREEQDLYTLTVSVSDQGSPPLSNSGVVYIYVTDVNDFRPTFPGDLLNAVVSVSEAAALNHTVVALEAVDLDLDAMLTYRIVSLTATNLQGEPLTNISAIEGWFAVDLYNGVVHVNGTLDRETAARVILTISAHDSASVDPALSTSDPNAMVTIQITDINDNAPVYQPPGTTYIYVTIQEESSMGTIITNIRAIDPDNPINGEVTYMLVGNLSDYVTIHPITGQITVNQIIDRELYDWLNFTIIATDNGTPSLSTPIPISIQILDVNDHNPIFDKTDYTATVTENSDGGTYVTVVTATDQDLDQFGEVTYTLTGGDGLFAINSTTGVITALQPLDREDQSVYTLTVIAVDNPGGSQTNRRQGSATVTITVGNVNEHPPTTQPNFPFGIPEGQPGGTLVGVIEATDPDDPLQELNFTFVFVEPPDGDVLFYINQTTGEIFTTVPLEADNATYGNTFNITVLISDNGNPPQTTTTTTIITIQDTNDNDPLFPNGPYDLTTSEATPVGDQVTVVTAVDFDQNAVLTYSIVNGNVNRTFFINPTNGEILITKPLDFETRTMYNLTVQVSDQDGRTGTTYVVIRIMDANDQGPVFLRQPYLFDVNENVDIGTEIGLIEAVDADPDPSNSQLTYHILSSVPADAPFAINETTGVITSSGALDREMQDSYSLTVEVRNVRFVPGRDDVTYKLSTLVTITILDLNDNTPLFSGSDNITRTFPENSEMDFPIYQPSAQDDDIGENGRVTYSIVSGNVENTFSIDPQTGAIVLAKQIHTLAVPTYVFTLVVEARDNGNPSLYSNITLNAVVGDYNDNAPQFVMPVPGQILLLPENEPIGFQIAPVLAVDIDSGSNGHVTYGFLNEESARLFYFQREGDTTYLYANFSADRETRDQYNFVLLATDGGTPNPLQTPLEVTVVITDKQDNEPFFVRVDNNVAIVQQLNVTEHTSVNTSFGIVTLAQDPDLPPNDVIYYYIVDGNDKGLFGINSTTGELIVLGDLDRETIATYRLVVKATNNASYVSSGTYDIATDVSLKEVQITIGDINDNGPKFTTVLYTAGIPLDAEINTQVICIQATDLDLGGGGAVTYGIQSATFVLGQDEKAFEDIFYIDENSGCIRTRNLLNGVTAGGYFDLSVTATDKFAGLSDTALVRVFVLDNNQQVVVVVDSDIDTVTRLQDQLVQIISNITGGIVNVDSITYYIDSDGNTVKDQTMIVLHVIDPETNSLVDADIVLRLIDENSQSIRVLFQQYGVVDVYALAGGVGGVGFGIIEIALLAIALLLFLGALIFIIILCCLQRKLLKKIHGNSPAVIYSTRADADVKEATTYQGSNPLWLETGGGLPDDWPDSISLLGGNAAREYESQEASMDFFSDIQPEIARDALVMTAMVSDGQSASLRSKTLSNGGVSNGRVGSEKAQLRTVSSTGPLIVDSANMDGSVSTLTNRLNRDGSVSANLTGQEGGYSASGAAYSFSTASFSGGPSTSKKLTSEKAQEIRQMLDDDQGVEAYLGEDEYRDRNAVAAARASYREQVEFDNQLSPITEEDTASSWSSWTRDSERSGARYAGLGSLDRNRITDRPSKDYADPMNNFTTSTSVEESYTRSVKSPAKTESSSYTRRANSKTYSPGVTTSIGMVTLTEETPEMIDDEESETSSNEGRGKTYTYNIMGDSSEGAHSVSGGSSGQSATKRAGQTSTMNFAHEGDDTDEVIEERDMRRSVKTTRGYTNSGYDNFMDEESRL